MAGAELLERALAEGRFDSDGELISESEGEEGGSGSELELESEEEEGGEGGSGGSGSELGGGLNDDDGEAAGAGGSGSDSEGWSSEEEEGEEGEEAGGSGSELELEPGEEGASGSGSEGEEEEEAAASGSGSGSGSEEEDDDGGAARRKRRRTQQQQQQARQKAPQAGSIAQLKKQLAAKKAADAAAAAGGEGGEGGEGGVPLEWGRILTEEDFERIRALKHRRLVDAAMQVGAGSSWGGGRRRRRRWLVGGRAAHGRRWTLPGRRPAAPPGARLPASQPAGLRARLARRPPTPRCCRAPCQAHGRTRITRPPLPSTSLPAPQKHGLKSASKRERARAAAEEEADEMLALKDRLAVMHEEVRGRRCCGAGWAG